MKGLYITSRETKHGKVFDVRFRYEGKQVHRVFRTRSECVDFGKSYKPEAPVPVPEAASMLFENAVAAYLDTRRGELSQNALYCVRHTFQKHILPTFTGMKLGDIKKADILRWQSALWNQTDEDGTFKYKQGTCTQARSTFSTFTAWCSDVYGIVNPFEGLKTPRRRETKDEVVAWNFHEFDKFDVCVEDDSLRVLFNVLFWSGLRLGEALALKPEDVVKTEDGDVYVLHVSKTATFSKGCCTVTAPKTASSNRDVVLPDFMTYVLDAYMQTVTGTFVFGDGERYYSKSRIETAFKKAIAKSGVPETKVHALRHSHASMLIALNVPVPVVSRRLGHKNTGVTSAAYTHVIEDCNKTMRGVFRQLKAAGYDAVPLLGHTINSVYKAAAEDAPETDEGGNVLLRPKK